MKLKERSYTKKDGTSMKEYTVTTRDATGYGMSLGESLTLTLKFPAKITEMQKKDGSGSFQSVKITGTPHQEFENCELNQYNNIVVQVPSSLAKKLMNTKEGDIVRLFPESRVVKVGTTETTKVFIGVRVNEKTEQSTLLDENDILSQEFVKNIIDSLVSNPEVFKSDYIQTEMVMGQVSNAKFVTDFREVEAQERKGKAPYSVKDIMRVHRVIMEKIMN